MRVFQHVMTVPFLLTALAAAAQTNTAQKRSTDLPNKMRFCAFNCFTLTLENGHYTAVKEGDPSGAVVSTYTVVRFTRDSVVINRTDTGGASAVLRGRLSADMQSVENGNAEFHNKDGSTLGFPFQLAWGESISNPVASSSPASGNMSGSRGQTPVQQAGTGTQRPSQQACQAAGKAALSEPDTATEAENRQMATRPNPYARTTPGRFNLSGTWTFGDCGLINGQATITRYKITQQGDSILAVADTPGWEHDKDILLKARYTGVNEIEGVTALNEQAATSTWILKPQKIVIFGPDRIKFGPSGISLTRLSLAGVYDAKCDEQNLQTIEGPSALFRGEEAAYFAGDYRLAACWLKVGAQQDEPASEGLLSSLYYQGLGVPQDYSQALRLASKAASHGNDFGENQLWVIYSTGNGAEINPGLARYWMQKSRSQARSNVDLSWGPRTLGGMDKSTPLIAAGAIPFYLVKPDQRTRHHEQVADCTVQGAGEISPDIQWKNSQIAFGEKNFPQSACWALYASIQGNTDAQLALAWFFDAGIGTDRRSDATTMWYAEVAKKGNVYAESYMASYFTFIERNPARAAEFQDKISSQPGGNDVLKKVAADVQAGPKPPQQPIQFEIRLPGTFSDFAHAVHRDEEMHDAYQQAYRSNGGNPDRAREAAERAGAESDAENSFFGALFSMGRDDQQQGQDDAKAKAEAHDRWVEEEWKTEARMIKSHLNQQH